MNKTTAKDYCKSIDNIVRIYNHRGFRIRSIDCNGEYKTLMVKVKDGMGIHMNYTDAQAHKSRAERNNRFIKEWIRVGLH